MALLTAQTLVKKITLRIWPLREEIESVIKKQLEERPKDKIDLEALSGQYQCKEETENAEYGKLKVVEGGKGKTHVDNNKHDSAQKIVLQQQCPTHIPPEKIHSGSVVISELSMDQIYFFSSTHFVEGQAIVIEFMIPQRFIMHADVVYSRPYSMRSRVISSQKYSHRIAATFTFLKEGERTLLRNFLKSILPIEKKTKRLPPKSKVPEKNNPKGEPEIQEKSPPKEDGP